MLDKVAKTKAINSLTRASRYYGILSVLSLFGNNLSVRLPVDDEVFQRPITEMGFPDVITNRFMRGQIHTLADFAQVVATPEGLKSIHSVGELMEKRMKSYVLQYCYETMSEKQRRTFWDDFLEQYYA